MGVFLGCMLLATVGVGSSVASACTADSQCSTGQWCNETLGSCTAQLANGTAMPTDPPHANPTLNGICTANAATLVCTSGTCDTSDNKCGYANGDGPCTIGNGSMVCRSGACSVNGTCLAAAGTCNVDADCSVSDWCLESTHTCEAKLFNGVSIPNDPPHVSPVLNSVCTAAAGALVCVSGVCDTDNKCGFLNSDGPCNSANGGTVCRSQVCGVDNRCGYPNGSGPCTAGNSGTICRSGVCDPNATCGYANGDGPCTGANASIVCDSGMCSVSQVCEPAGGCVIDADCQSGYSCHSFACVVSSADLSVASGGIAPSTVEAGANVTYTIDVVDAGPDAAASAQFRDTLPAQAMFVSLANPSGWSCVVPTVGQSGVATCSDASLGTGTAPFTLVIQAPVSLDDGSILINSAVVSSSTSDPNTGNDSGTMNVTVYKSIFKNGFE